MISERKPASAPVPALAVVGAGYCRRCHDLAARAQQAVRELGWTFHVETVIDLQHPPFPIPLFVPPALAIDGVIRVQGGVPTVAQLRTLLLACPPKAPTDPAQDSSSSPNG